ncbi:MAG: hypothetical protein QN147_04170 [Armatimonadota bacterium]|nr:hypothetical protein [Armatimonadota bacterium]MDR7456904.1 hypothetical protein [Armatimonadota bacterium]MDR7511204.1 hypothetical protein [Armatimonadota bacterium]
MAETVIVLAVLAASLAIAAVARSYRRFAELRERLAAYLAATAPELEVEPTDAGLRARVLGAEVLIDLAALARRRPRGVADDAWFAQVLADLRARVPAPQAPPLALVADRLLPQLRPRAYVEVFEGYPPPQRLVWREGPAGLAVTYIIAGVHQWTAVTRAALEAWRLDPDGLHARALANLRAQTRHLVDEIGGPRRRYEHLDGLDATRVLVPELVIPPDVADPLIAIPEESVLLIAPATERVALETEAAARHAASARPLTPGLLRP